MQYEIDDFVLRAHQSVSPYELAAECLRFASSATEFIDQSMLRPGGSLDDNLSQSLAALVASGASPGVPVLMRADVDNIVSAVQDHSSPPLAAWYVAQALTVQVAGFLKSALSSFEDGHELVRGDVLPIFLAGPPCLYKLVDTDGKQSVRGLTMKPSTMRSPRDLSKVPGLALWKGELPIAVTIDTVAGNRFDPKSSSRAVGGSGLTVGLMFPNSSMDELDREELIIDENEKTFFGVRFVVGGSDHVSDEAVALTDDARDFNSAEERYLRSGIERLSTAHAQVVMLPELCQTPTRVEILHDIIESMLDRSVDRHDLEVVIGGSLHHVDSSQAKRNSLTVFFPGKRSITPRTHNKVGAFDFDFGGVRYVEGVELGRNIRLFMGETVTAMVLICSDFLDECVQEILKSVAPTIVFIASMTPRVEEFLGMAQGLSAAAQVTTVMVNNPKIWDVDNDPRGPSSAFWVGPIRTEREYEFSADEIPGVALLTVGQGFDQLNIND
ncbi:hypothetical protein ACNHUS_18695 [Actinomycetes bacterium M1A6_2h]